MVSNDKNKFATCSLVHVHSEFFRAEIIGVFQCYEVESTRRSKWWKDKFRIILKRKTNHEDFFQERDVGFFGGDDLGHEMESVPPSSARF